MTDQPLWLLIRRQTWTPFLGPGTKASKRSGHGRHFRRLLTKDKWPIDRRNFPSQTTNGRIQKTEQTDERLPNTARPGYLIGQKTDRPGIDIKGISSLKRTQRTYQQKIYYLKAKKKALNATFSILIRVGTTSCNKCRKYALFSSLVANWEFILLL